MHTGLINVWSPDDIIALSELTLSELHSVPTHLGASLSTENVDKDDLLGYCHTFCFNSGNLNCNCASCFAKLHYSRKHTCTARQFLYIGGFSIEAHFVENLILCSLS